MLAHFVHPREYSETIRKLWRTQVSSAAETASVTEPATSGTLPDVDDLETLITTSLQVSLQRDELRELTFRLICCPPEAFDVAHHDEYSLFVFDTARPLSVTELRKLAPAADFYRTLLGVWREDGGLKIWGLVHSGPEWMQVISGGRGTFVPLPNWPVISVLAPGSLAAARGSYTLALYRSGTVVQPSLEVFESTWLPAIFKSDRDDLLATLRERIQNRGVHWNTIDPLLPRYLGQHAIRRVLSLIRRARNGGALIMLPTAPNETQSDYSQLLKLKYAFPDHPQRLVFRRTLLEILEYLACDFRRPGIDDVVDWEAYKACKAHTVKKLEDRLFEFAQLVAEISRVDGAVVLNHRLEVLGFGAEILARHELDGVYRARDAEGNELIPMDIEGFGTRHRSAFRLCAIERDALVVVVSQDGSISFIKNHRGKVTYWDQVAVSVLDI